jgi:diketogulonate reductase-like aldo/keto reductase
MTLTTYNQIPVPSFMYGTAWKKQETARLVQLAVAQGFRAIDTANQLKHYDEALVGDALPELYKQGIGREQLFLQTKFTPADGQDHRMPYDPAASLTTQVQQSMDSSLKHLHVDHLDSYVLHGPYSRYGLGAADWEVWTAMEQLFQSGKTKMIGISNVSAEQVSQLCAKAKVKPMMVQNRCYASMGWDREVREICRNNNVIYQGFSLLTANQRVLAHPMLQSMGKRLGCGPAQIIFRFAQQIGMLPLTGTTNAQHMQDDLRADQISLSSQEMQHIENLAL